MLRMRPRLGVLVRAGERSLILSGTAEVMGPQHVHEAVRLARNALSVQRALASYATRNRRLLAGYTLDLATLARGALPHDRVLVAMTVLRGMVVDHDEVVHRWGRWRWGEEAPSHRRSVARATSPLPLTRALLPLPAGVPSAARSRAHTVLGWTAAYGPLALPASWDAPRLVACVSTAMFTSAYAPTNAAACVCLDDSAGARPTHYAGVMVRGDGIAGPRNGVNTDVTLAVDRATWWTGFSSGTVARRSRV